MLKQWRHHLLNCRKDWFRLTTGDNVEDSEITIVLAYIRIMSSILSQYPETECLVEILTQYEKRQFQKR